MPPGGNEFESNGQSWAPQIYTQFRKTARGVPQPQVCGDFSHFRNRKCTLHFRKLRPQYLLLFCPRDDLFIFLKVKFCHQPDVDLQKKTKKGHHFPDVTSNPENNSVHFFQAVSPRIKQHCLLLCGFAVNFNFSPQIRKYLRYEIRFANPQIET